MLMSGGQRRQDAAGVVVPMAQPAEAEMQEAREAHRRAVEREEELRRAEADATALREAATEERAQLLRRLVRVDVPGPEARKEMERAIRDADARIAEADAALSRGRELMQLAEQETREASKRIEQIARREVATEERRVDARMIQRKLVWDEAEREYHALNSLKTDAGHLLRGSFGYRATVADFQRMLARMRAALADAGS